VLIIAFDSVGLEKLPCVVETIMTVEVMSQIDLDSLPPREKARALIAKKDKVEEELQALEAFLNGSDTKGSTPEFLVNAVDDPDLFNGNGSGGVGMKGPLVDAHGFPRADIDIVAVRMARQKVITLLNDHKALMKQIENTLQEVYAKPAESNSRPEPVAYQPEFTSSGTAPVSEPASTSSTTHHNTSAQESASSSSRTFRKKGAPFIRFNAVHPDGPGAAAGLQRSDELIRFGDFAVYENEDPQELLTRFNAYVATVENTAVVMFYQRPSESAHLATEVVMTSVVPRKWQGKGLLGCHMVAM
jgi:26S proteasome non-ATPase regulatory subunit 9